MKKVVIYFTIVMLMVASVSNSYAAFTPKYREATTVVSQNVSAAASDHKKTFSERKVPQLFSNVKKQFMPGLTVSNHGERSGWQGIVSLCCGILGLVTGGLLVVLAMGIAAIVFAILGINKALHKNTGLAIAGLVLGCIELLVAIVVIVFVATVIV